MVSTNIVPVIKQILSAHGFWLEQSTQRGISKVQYGIPGTLLRRNIISEWYDNVISRESNVFPIEGAVLNNGCSELSDDLNNFKVTCDNEIVGYGYLRRSFKQEMLQQYIPTLNMMNSRLPFTLVQIGTVFSEVPGNNSEGLWRCGVEETNLAMQHYTSPSNIFQMLDQLVVDRLRWWKKFLINPGNLITEEIKSDESEVTSTNIQYKCPWGIETIETICNMGDQYIQNLETQAGISCKGKWIRKMLLPHVLHLQTSLEKSMMVILVDSFKEKEMFSTKRNTKQEPRYVLHLHSHLAPFKVALISSGNKTKEIRHLANHFLHEIRQNGVMVLDTADSDGQTSQFKRFDELGTPYNIIINDQSLDTGIVGLRNRDTNLREQLHVSNICDKLNKYLKPI